MVDRKHGEGGLDIKAVQSVNKPYPQDEHSIDIGRVYHDHCCVSKLQAEFPRCLSQEVGFTSLMSTSL